jgi:hypothetical protein
MAVKQFPRPACVQAFLGLINYYRRFIPVTARILKPLTDALQGKKSQKMGISWSPPCRRRLKRRRRPSQRRTSPSSPDIALITDASSTHIGTLLQQRRFQQSWRPLAFFSQKLSPAESRYSAFDRELLAVHSAVLHFRHLLEGRQFTIFSDHKPLTGALSRVSEPRSDRQRRQLSFIVEFVSEIKHIAGRANIVTDTLSRPHNTLKYLLLA